MRDKQSAEKTPLNSNTAPLILTFCVISALVIYLVYAGNFIFGSKAGNWDYGYFKTIAPLRLWIPAAALTLTGLTIFVGGKLVYLYEKITLLGSFVSAFILQSLIHRIYPIPMASVIKSDASDSFYSLALRYSPFEILARYTQLVPSFPLHARTNMPGKIILFQLFTPLTTSPRFMGYLIILLSTLGAFLVYGICMRLFHDRRAAFYGFMLYVLLPGKLFFFPILNTITPLFILLCLYLFLVYIDGKRVVYLGLLGVVLYLLLLFEPTPLVTGIIFLGILWNAIVEKKILIKDLWRVLVIPLAAFLLVYLLFSVLFSFNLLQAFQFILKDAVDFNSRADRPYLLWLVENPKEFFYAAELPVMMIFIYLVIQILSQLRQIKYNISSWSPENIFTLSLLATFCVVLFLGINRGEITRLWIYLAVFFQIPAAFYIAKNTKNEGLFVIVACTLVAQSMVALQRVGFVVP